MSAALPVHVDLRPYARSVDVPTPEFASWLESLGVNVLRLSRQRWRAPQEQVLAALRGELQPVVDEDQTVATPRATAERPRRQPARRRRESEQPGDDWTPPTLPAGHVLLSPVRSRGGAA